MTSPLVTVVIPTIKPRRPFLQRAVNSVLAQALGNYPKPVIEISIDRDHEGAAATRNRALLRATTPYVAFLDDDDYFLQNHLKTLLDAAFANPDMVVIYPGCQVLDAAFKEVPLQEDWGRFGKEFDPDLMQEKSYIPVTSLVRTPEAQFAQFGRPEDHPESHYDDWGFYLRILRSFGPKFLHIPEVTWVWHHHGRNTSGLGDRW